MNRREDNNRKGILTKETIGMTLCLFGGLILIVLCTGSLIFGEIGTATMRFLLGIFGYFSYPLFVLTLVGGILLVLDKRFYWPLKTVVLGILGTLFLCCLIHTATSASLLSDGETIRSYGGYLSACFAAGKEGLAGSTFGGALFALLVYPFLRYTTAIGCYLIFSVLVALCVGGIVLVKRLSVPAAEGETDAAKPAAPRQKREKKAKKLPERVQIERDGASDGEPVPGETQDAPTPIFYTPRETGRSGGGYPAPDVRSVPPASPELMPHSPDYLDRVKKIEDKLQEFSDRRTPPFGQTDPYASPSDMPDSDYQRRNDRFYANAEKVLNRPVQPDAPVQFSQTPSSAADGRSILYPGEDYAKRSYQKNLIFDTDSDFNHRRTAPPRAQGGYKPVPSYEDSYASELGTGQPRKIVTDTTARRETPYAFRDTVGGDRAVESVPFGDLSPRQTPPAPPTREEGRDRLYGERPSFSQYWNMNYIDPVRPAPQKDRPAPYERKDGSEREASGWFASSERSVSERPVPPHSVPERTDSERQSERFEPERFDPEQNPRFDETDRAPEPFSERGERPAPIDRPRREPSAAREDPARKDPLSFGNLFSSSNANSDTGRVKLDPDHLPPLRRPMRRGEERSEQSAPDEPEGGTERADDSAMGVFGRDLGNIEPPKPKAKPISRKYKRPPFDFFAQYNETLASDPQEIAQNSEAIVRILGEFRIEAEVMKVTSGPTVTRYDIEIPPGIQARKVASYDEEIARKLHVQGGVSIFPNFETGYISIEVPNKQRATVGLASILLDKKFQNAEPTALMFGMGKDIEGRAICGNISKMTHLLVAGSTGSGKSVFLNGLIISLIMKYSPEELRMILIDPKQVEFVGYQDLPHLMINEIVNDPTRVINILDWAIEEMGRRYTLFQQRIQMGKLVREVDEYNASLSPEEPRLPKIVIIIDELADLMLRAKKEIEDRVQNLTQKSRAAGIHMIIATQRPSVDVITGIIKANLPTRIAFRVAQEVDSRTILDASGAEKLLGNGDFLYRTMAMPSPFRVQGAFLSSDEVQRIVEYVKENNEAVFDSSVSDYLNNVERRQSGGGEEESDFEEGIDPVYIEALQYVVTVGQASISMIQRRCGVGYNRAGKIIEWMETMGYISPFDGAKARKVLLTKEEFEAKYGGDL